MPSLCVNTEGSFILDLTKEGPEGVQVVGKTLAGRIAVRFTAFGVEVGVEGYNPKGRGNQAILTVDLGPVEFGGKPIVSVWDNDQQYAPSQTITLQMQRNLKEDSHVQSNANGQ